jgi:hypothetical protein
MTQNDVMQLFIGTDVGAGTPTTSANSYISDYTKLVDGEMAVVNSHNMVLSASTVLSDDLVKRDGIKIVMREGTDIRTSDLIKQNNIVTIKSQIDVAAANQVSYIGYNGTSGAIVVANSKLYVVRLNLKELDQGQQMILNAPYKSDASATQQEIGLGLALALSNVLRRQAVQPIQADLVSSVAHAATAGVTYDVTVVKGEKTFSILTNRYYDSSSAMAVGDFVRFSDVTTVTGTLVTDPVYKIVSFPAALIIEVDRPIEAESGTYPAAIASANRPDRCSIITAAKALAGDFGIKFEGVTRAFTAGRYKYSKVEFTIGLDSASSFSTTPVTYSTAATLGQGNYEQIAQLEWELLGNDGNGYPGDFLWSPARARATSGKTYDQLSITYYGDHSTAGVGGTPRRMKQLLLAFETGFSTTEAPDIICDVIAAYSTQAVSIAV